MEPQRILARVLMTLFCCQSLTASPAIGRFMIHAWKRGDDLENKNADKIRNGVVGRIGKKAPIIPITKLNQARMNQSHFTLDFFPSPL